MKPCRVDLWTKNDLAPKFRLGNRCHLFGGGFDIISGIKDKETSRGLMYLAVSSRLDLGFRDVCADLCLKFAFLGRNGTLPYGYMNFKVLECVSCKAEVGGASFHSGVSDPHKRLANFAGCDSGTSQGTKLEHRRVRSWNIAGCEVGISQGAKLEHRRVRS